eukprot:m.937567 g.937567  ORF g.937567 m.937567 type:complete len:268 (-) comp23815_c0_seq22:1466-2269(-)
MYAVCKLELPGVDAFFQIRVLSVVWVACQALSLGAEVPLSSWAIHEALDIGTFGTYTLVYEWLHLLEARLQPYYDISKVDDIWNATEEFYCVPSVYPDCTTHYVQRRPNTEEILIKQIEVNASFVPPQTTRAHAEKYELEAHCTGHHLAYTMNVNYTGTDLTEEPLDNSADINNLLTTPFYGESVPIVADVSRPRRYQVLFQYTLQNLGGIAAVLSLELSYPTDERRALLDRAERVELQLRLAGLSLHCTPCFQAATHVCCRCTLGK